MSNKHRDSFTTAGQYMVVLLPVILAMVGNTFYRFVYSIGTAPEILFQGAIKTSWEQDHSAFFQALMVIVFLFGLGFILKVIQALNQLE